VVLIKIRIEGNSMISKCLIIINCKKSNNRY